MGKYFTYAGVIVLVLLLIFNIWQPFYIKAMAVEVLRSYQELAVKRETAGWSQLAGRHFIVKYRSGDQASARLVLSQAEALYDRLGKSFGFFPHERVTVAVYTDRLALNRVFGWGSEESAMGVYWAGVVRVLSPTVWLKGLDSREMARVFTEEGPVAHEYIHLLVDFKTRGNYSRWLTEGLAQYGEEKLAGVIPAGTGKNQPLDISLNELDQRFDDPHWQEYSYTVSKDLIDYLAGRYGAERIPLLLDDLGGGMSLDQAFSKELGVNLKGFVSEYNRQARAAGRS